MVALLWALPACECGSDGEAPSFAHEDLEPPREPPPAPSPDKVYAPAAAQAAEEGERVARVQPAFVRDEEYVDAEPVAARRLVYRLRLLVPRNLGERDDELPSAIAELDIDLSVDRLRARFVGNGWPVDAGSEVRIRRDEPGAYVFDADGGRPLGPGQLAHWFEGGRPHVASYRVRPPPRSEQSGPGDLVCRLIAEWVGDPPSEIERRCGDGGTPPDFRVGFWRADRTADVEVELPRNALRADHVDPPRAIAGAESRAFLPPSTVARIHWDRPPIAHEPDPEAPAEGVLVENRSSARMIFIVQGTPVGWLDSGEEAHFVGFEPGRYDVAGIRPFGAQAAGKREIHIPGRVRLPR